MFLSYCLVQVWTTAQPQNLGRVRNLAKSNFPFWSYLPLSAEKLYFLPCDRNNSCSFYQIIMKLTDNQDNHKISDEFKIRPNRAFHFGVTCPWVQKKKITYFWPCDEISPCSFYRIIMKLTHNQDNHKITNKFEIWQIKLFISELLALECRKKPIFDLVTAIAPAVFIESLWNWQITRTSIKSRAS